MAASFKIVDMNGRPFRASAPAYEGAATGRRVAHWRVSSAGPNALLAGSLDQLRNRARDADRNNPWIGRALASLASNEIGAGIIPRARSGNQDLDNELRLLWDDWAPEADADGILDIYGLQALAALTRRRDGEVFVRLRPRRLADALSVPIQVQILEADHCPITHNGVARNGNPIRHGIEFDKLGRRAAYWMHRQHPGEWVSGQFAYNNLVRVPAAQVIHHYRPRRPGQIRGEPEPARALLRAKIYHEYEDAELERKKNRSQFSGTIEKRDTDWIEDDWQYNPITGEAIVQDAEGVPTLDLQPGTFVPLLPGEQMNLFGGDDTGQGYSEFTREQKLAIAAALGVPYELMTGDWGKVNDRLVRAILQEFRRMIEADQDHLMVHQVCQGIRQAWMDQAVLAGAVQTPMPDYSLRRRQYQRCEWRPDGWDYVNPTQDIAAKIQAIRAGLTSRARTVADQGEDVEEVDRQNAADNARSNALGLDYETDTEAASETEPTNEGPQ